MNNEIKEENIRNLIKQGHHRRPSDMVVEVIALDSEEDDVVDVETFEFKELPKVVKSEIKKEPVFNDNGKLDFEDLVIFDDDQSDLDSSSSDTADMDLPLEIIERIALETKLQDRRDDASQEPRRQEKLDKWKDSEDGDTQTQRLERAKRKQSTRFVARRTFDEKLDEKNPSRKAAKKSTSQNQESRSRKSPKKHTSPKKLRSSIQRKKSPNRELTTKEDDHEKKRKRIEDDEDLHPKKKKRRSKSPENLDIKPQLKTSRSVMLLNNEMSSSIPLDLNSYKARKTEEKIKSAKVEQDITSERINNIEDRLNELKMLKLNYQLFQLQQLKSTYNLPSKST